MKILIKNAFIINEGISFKGSLLIDNEWIAKIYYENESVEEVDADEIIDAEGLWLLPGAIDDQVHFREPGLTHKADIQSESRAAVAGGITSFMEMPNTIPQTTTIDLLEEKYSIAERNSYANYSFYLGATNDNIEELLKVNPKNVCGIKVFMGSSTGDMLVNNVETLQRIFSEAPSLIAVHCEDEAIIQHNLAHYRELYGDDIECKHHPFIRSEEACYKSSSLAVELAKRYNTRLHLLHVSTEKELSLFQNDIPLSEKMITAEACVHHLWFSDSDYDHKGAKIKWNPAVKTESDRLALLEALNSNHLDVVATDHAPHTLEEKMKKYFESPSGGPLVQHALIVMIQLAKQGYITVEKVVEKMCHAPADLFRIDKRGYIRKNYYADLVLVNPNSPNEVNAQNLLYKCAWSPFEGEMFEAKVEKTFVNGHLVYDNGSIDKTPRGMRLNFNKIENPIETSL